MFDVQDINGNDDLIIAYKIVEKEYVDRIVNLGHIFFSLVENYRRMEQQDKHEIGDRYEAGLTNYISEYIKLDGKYVEIHGPNVGNNARINANQCAFCFYMVGLKSYDCGVDGKYRFRIPYSDLKKICKDKGGIGNCAIIVFDSNTITKIYDSLKSRGFLYEGGKVIYDDFNYIPKYKDIDSWQYALECCFHKLNCYSYQNEFRIVALNDERRPIADLFIDVDENEIQVLELKDGCDFCSCIEMEAKMISDKIVGVSLHIEHSLETVTTDET